MNEMTPVAAQSALPVRHVENYLDQIKPRMASNLLLWLMLSFLVIFVAWAGLTKLDRTVMGIGRVIPSAQLQIVSNLEGGMIEEVLVRTGDLVKQGQPMVRLNPVLSSAELGSGEATVFALQAKIARLSAEVQGRTPSYPAASDEAMAEQIRIQQALHASRIADLSSAQSALAARVNAARRAVAEAEAMSGARASALSGAQQQADVIRPLVERGIEPRMSLVDAENRAAIARDEAAAARASISRAIASVAEANAAQAQQRSDWRARAGDELAAAQGELGSRMRSLPALADRSARTIIRAPLSGKINRVLISTVGGSVRPGEPLVEIVPSEKGLLVELLVSPKDIAFVRTGQSAKVDITAYESAIYGSLQGKVVSISPDATLNERTGESHYTVKVRTDGDALVTKDGTRLPIGSGMVANASLIGDKRSILEYIFTPITRLSERALRE
jgi:membrane fusion protein, adhesin transport system